jgi:hypothetical protein
MSFIKDAVVSKKAQIKYKQWVDRFFRENESFIKPRQRLTCLDSIDYFLSLMESAVEHYYLELEE